MRELEELKKLLAESATIIAEIESNKESIKILGAYATEAIQEISSFLQGNIESILSTFTMSLTDAWGRALVERCNYLGAARKVLMDSGFTSEQAFDILYSKKDELKDMVNEATKTVKEAKADGSTKKT